MQSRARSSRLPMQRAAQVAGRHQGSLARRVRHAHQRLARSEGERRSRARRRRCREAQSRIHAHHLADRRPRQQGRGDCGQSRDRRIEHRGAAHDRRLARPDLRDVRRRRADLPQVQRAVAQRGERPSSRDAANPVLMGLANETDYPHRGAMVFVDNQVDPRTGTIRARASFDNKDGYPDAGPVRARQAARPQLVSAPCWSTTARSAPTRARSSCTSSTRRTRSTYRPVKVGRLTDGLRIVQQGLQPGETRDRQRPAARAARRGRRARARRDGCARARRAEARDGGQ